MTNNHSRPPPLDALITSLFALARQFEDFMNEHTENLDFESYADLTQYETKLLAYGNALATTDRIAFIRDELAEAEGHLAFMHERIGGKP
jgi:hypothetical protein